MPSYKDRIAASLDHPVDAACGARAPSTIWGPALAAGLGAAIGSIVGGSALWAGAGGGLGALVGYLILGLRLRGTGLSQSMALVLTPDRLELHRLGWKGIAKTAGLVRAVPYAEVRDVSVRERWLDLRVTITTAGEPLVLDMGKRGIAAASPCLEELRRRIAA